MTIHIISNLIWLALLISTIIFWRKSKKINAENREWLRMIEELERVKITVEMWNRYIWRLEAIEKFELCDIIRRHIDGKAEDELVEPPQGFKVLKDVNDPTNYFIRHPSK